MDIDIFLSYSSKDKVVADAIVSALENENIRCWYAPRDIEPGANWGESITEAIQDCKLFLLIFSGNSNQSKRVLDEVYYAISEEKAIIPFRIENLDPTGAMRLHLSSRHWLDAYHPSWESHINRLVNTMAVHLGREALLQVEAVETPPAPLPMVEAPKKKSPWLWISLAGILVILLTGIGILWNANRESKSTDTATAVSEVMPTEAGEDGTMEAAPATETLSPTDSPAENPTEMLPTSEPQEVILNGYFDVSIFNLDPQVWLDNQSLNFHENLFLNLINLDENAETSPEAALSWTISPDGTIYTFKLRSDIPWVLHTPGGETVQVLDEEGVPRFVTAQDFVNGFRRICFPRDASEWGFAEYFSGLLKGCQELLEYDDPDNLPQELIEAIGARAISTDELLIELEKPSGYFLSMTSSTICAAIPQWAIDKYGIAWTNPGNIPTNGYYVIDEWVLGESVRWKRNPLLPEDLAGEGNIDVIEFDILEDTNSAYTLWLENELDYSAIPLDNLPNHFTNYANETTQISEPLVWYFLLRLQEAPFDNVHVRRAFAGALDRATFIDDVLAGEGLPMIHLGPPFAYGAPAMDEVGVGYDLEFAHAEFEAAGYPNCQGFPQVTLWVYQGKLTSEFKDAIRDWERKLGCPEGTIQIDTSLGPEIDLMYAGWVSDYPDEHNYIGAVLNCEFPTYIMERTCNEIDDWIAQAAQEINPQKRIEWYARIEEAFFGEEGEFPLIPIMWSARHFADHTWLHRTQPKMGKEQFYLWTVDMEAKLAATGQE
jgi:oligopeptide transport system substrate-binding protein